MDIQARIDPLIAERAEWLYRDSVFIRPIRALLNALLGYEHTIELGREFDPLPWQEIMDRLATRLAREVEATGLDNVPAHGAAMLVANHPTGIADGIMLYHLLAPRRPDLFFYANSDILRVLPQMAGMIAPVEWREEKRSLAKTRETMAYTRAAMAAGRLGIMFPSGRLAKRRGLRLFERPWMPSAAMIARKFDVPVIPVNLRARNSALFYLFDLIHASLRDITLFHETMNKARQPYRIVFGPAISPRSLPAQSQDGIAQLRRATLALAGKEGSTVSLVRAAKRAGWV
ncbi:MAG TPA: glycerol acyltransferase [Rhodobacteraceae bacterium]|jgi:putative hemolysin|nr:1-acyl-sn-glycerol-3-phosphate acyltransferase [Paracoccaceae bacterium]HBG97645.1 glycerol acyltransferase [Paracoccaceae bacterium]